MMAGKTTDVMLDGEKVTIAIKRVARQNQTFIRIGKDLIAGIVEDAVTPNIYIWQEVNGIYQNLGDIVFKGQQDGSIIWSIYVETGHTDEFRKRAAAHLADQGKLHALCGSSGNHVEMLSLLNRVKA